MKPLIPMFILVFTLVIGCKARNPLNNSTSGVSGSTGKTQLFANNIKDMFVNHQLKTVFAITNNSELETYTLRDKTYPERLRKINIDLSAFEERENLEFLKHDIIDYQASQSGQYLALAHRRGLHLLEFDAANYRLLLQISQKISASGGEMEYTQTIINNIIRPLIKKYQVALEGEWKDRDYDDFLKQHADIELSPLLDDELGTIKDLLRKIFIDLYNVQPNSELAQMVLSLKNANSSDRETILEKIYLNVCGERGYQCEESLIDYYKKIPKKTAEIAATPTRILEVPLGYNKVVNVKWMPHNAKDILMFYTENSRGEHRLFSYDPNSNDQNLQNIMNGKNSLLASHAKNGVIPKVQSMFWLGINTVIIITTEKDVIYAPTPYLNTNFQTSERVQILDSANNPLDDFDKIIQKSGELYLIHSRCMWPLQIVYNHINNPSGYTKKTYLNLKRASTHECQLAHERYAEIKVKELDQTMIMHENNPGDYRFTTGSPYSVYSYDFAEQQFKLIMDRSQYDLSNSTDRFRISFDLTHVGLDNAYSNLYVKSKYYEALAIEVKNEIQKNNKLTKDNKASFANTMFTTILARDKHVDTKDLSTLIDHTWDDVFEARDQKSYLNSIKDLSKLKTTYNKKIEVSADLLPKLGYEFANLKLEQTVKNNNFHVFDTENAVFRNHLGELRWWSLN